MWIQINQTVFTPDAIIPSHLQMRYFHGVTNTLYMTRNGVGLWSENCANAHSQQVAHWNQTPIYKFIFVENEPHWVESFYLFSMHENCLRTKHVQFVRIVSNEAKWICLDWFFRPHNEKRALGQCRQHGKVRLKVKYKTHNSKFKLMNLGRAQFEFFFLIILQTMMRVATDAQQQRCTLTNTNDVGKTMNWAEKIYYQK